MFDISFSELLVIVVVALLVIGPEKLPKVARTLGAYAGRMQRFVAQVKDEVNREVRFEELQKLQQEVKSATLEVESSILAGVGSIQQDVSSAVTEPATTPIKRVRKKVDSGKANTQATPVETISVASSESVKKTRTTQAKKSTQANKPARASKKVAG